MPLQVISTRPAFFSAIAALLLFAMLQAAHADALVYKYIEKNGVTVYSQTRPDHYRPEEVQAITIESLPVEQQRAAIRMLAAMKSKVDIHLQERRAKLAKADQKIDKALKNLQLAESNLKRGSVPTSSDRIGKKSGGTRLKESYFSRVIHLENAIEKARLALDEAYNERNDLR